MVERSLPDPGTALQEDCDPAQRSDFILSVFVVLFGIAVLVAVPYQVEQPPALFGMASQDLDPAVFPRGVAICMIAVGLLLGARTWRAARRRIPSAKAGGIPRFAGTVSALGIALLYVLLLPPLGFILSSALAAIGLALLAGARNPLVIVLVAITVPSAIFQVFTGLLHVALPGFPWS